MENLGRFVLGFSYFFEEELIKAGVLPFIWICVVVICFCVMTQTFCVFCMYKNLSDYIFLTLPLIVFIDFLINCFVLIIMIQGGLGSFIVGGLIYLIAKGSSTIGREEPSTFSLGYSIIIHFKRLEERDKIILKYEKNYNEISQKSLNIWKSL